MERIFITLLCLVFLTSITINAQINDAEAWKKYRAEYESQFPIVDYDKPEPVNPEERIQRQVKNKRYDNYRMVVKEPSANSYGSELIDESIPPPAIPVAESNLVIIGEVLSATAHLSNDKTGIYSEFTVRVDEIFKNNTSSVIDKGSEVSLDRMGGIVRYQNGQKLVYSLSQKGLLRAGKSYALFLKSTDQSPNYKIVTGYELKENKTYPLDSNGRFEAYKGTILEDFKRLISETVTKLSKTNLPKP